MRKFPEWHFFARKAASDRRGNVAIMTALVLPVILVGVFGGVNVVMALSRQQELKNIAQVTCNRALKPLRMKILNDVDRTAKATQAFDTLTSDHKMAISSRTVTSGWLTANVKATATIPAYITFNNGSGYTTSVDVSCTGLPPFPKVGEVILSSNFDRPDGEALPMMYSFAGQPAWGVYDPKQFGWDGGSGPGVEIQDWSVKYNDGTHVYGELPAQSKSKYVVELDSFANSDMYKIVELHKGVYRFSFWYFGRNESMETNRVSVYLEGMQPVSAKVQKLTVALPRSTGWRYLSFDLPTSTYSLYKLWIAAEGSSDGQGGNFNDLKLEYIKRPFDS